MSQATERTGATGLVVVGGGRMGEALVRGLLAAGMYDPKLITVVEKLEGRRAELTAPGGLAEAHPGLTVDVEPPRSSVDAAILAVKPADAESACRAISTARPRRVLSIMAGVTLAKLEGWIGDGPAVLRAMPNTPALIGAGAAALAGGASAGPAELEWATGVLSAVGTVTTVPEHLLDAVTGLSGSGPAYVFLFAEALIDAGVLVGLSRPIAHQLVLQTLLGSARLLTESGDSPEVLRAGVTSPGGTTAAGLRALESAAVRSAILDAVSAATERSRQLGG